MSNAIINPFVIGAYRVNTVNFDGTNDYLTRGADLTGVSDGAEGLFSIWVNYKGGNGSFQQFHGTANTGAHFFINKNASDNIWVRGQNTGSGTVLEAFSNSAYTDASGWIHILASWNQTTSDVWLYVNDADDLAASPTSVANNIDYTQGDWSFGALPNGNNKLDADIGQAYLNLAAGSGLDLSVTSNRRKFISSSGRPVNLGSDGSTPTGAAPAVFFDGITSTWHTNDGAGGGFTENGALTDGTDSPSD